MAVKAEGQNPIDRLMERASRALVKMQYFEAERFCKDALRRAYEAADFERLARICMPLQEARRQKRQLAVDSGLVMVFSDPRQLRGVGHDIMPGCYLFQPPLLGVDARNFRDEADSLNVPVFVLCREPLTKDLKWPVVAVGQVSVRTRVDTPVPLTRNEKTVSRDDYQGLPLPTTQWFEAAAEAMGDWAIAKLKMDEPAAWRVDDLINYLGAHPDHEKLHQRLEEACRKAMTEELPEGQLHRPMGDDPFSF